MKPEIKIQNVEVVSESELDHVNAIFDIENKMLAMLSGLISEKAGVFISEKIEMQKRMLSEIVIHEMKYVKKLKEQSRPVIDDKFFQKKSLNINNL